MLLNFADLMRSGVSSTSEPYRGLRPLHPQLQLYVGCLCHEALDQHYVLSLYPVIVRLMEETLVRDLSEANQNDVDLPLSRYTSSQVLIE